MRKHLGFALWFLSLVLVVLDRLATAHTLPGDLQSLWDKYMSGFSPFLYLFLAAMMIATLYLFWPIIIRFAPFPGLRNDLSDNGSALERIAKPSDWFALVQTARVYRDELDKYPSLGRDASVHDWWGQEDGVDPDVSFPKRFLWEIIVGVNEAKKLKVRGRPANGSKIVEITSPLGKGQLAHANIQNMTLTGSDGRAYTDIEIQQDSIREYVAWLSSNWLDRGAALQLVYDELTSGRYVDHGQAMELTKALGKDSSDLWDHVGAWLIDGIKAGTIQAQGVCERRSQLEHVPESIDDIWDQDAEFDVKTERGNRWKLLKFERRSIIEYLSGLENDQPKNSP